MGLHDRLSRNGTVAALDLPSLSLGSPATLVSGQLVASPAFSPDSKTIAFLAPTASDGNFQLWTVGSSGPASASPQPFKLVTAGVFSSAESLDGIFNSRGLNNWHTRTLAEISITMLAGNSSGWQKANSPDVRNLNAAALADIAASKALDSAQPREIPAGKYTVILEPAAVLDIVGFMFWDYSGMAILDQRSFLTGRISSQLFGKNISIFDDVTHPLQTGCPFDGEGVRRKTLPLVENGVVKRVVYARGTAATPLLVSSRVNMIKSCCPRPR